MTRHSVASSNHSLSRGGEGGGGSVNGGSQQNRSLQHAINILESSHNTSVSGAGGGGGGMGGGGGITNNDSLRSGVSGGEANNKKKSSRNNNNKVGDSNAPIAPAKPSPIALCLASVTKWIDYFRTVNVPLLVILIGQCLVVSAAFAILVVVSDLQTNETAEELVRDSINAEMKFARTSIESPITTAEQLLLELRDRYTTYTTFDRREPCDHTEANISYSANFFADTSMAIKHNPLIAAMLHLRRSPTVRDPVSGEFSIYDQCIATSQYLYKLKNGVDHRLTTQSPTMSDFENLDQMEFVEFPDVPDHASHINAAMGSNLLENGGASRLHSVTWTPILVHNVRENALNLYMSGSAPFQVNVTLNGRTIRHYTYRDELPLPANESNRLEKNMIASTLALSLSMEDYLGVMRSITPIVDGAHTTLYDLNQKTMLYSSLFPANAQFDEETGSLYTASLTSLEELNTAYKKANPESLKSTGDVTIDFGSGEIVSSTIFSTASGIRFAVVQSVPRSYYFGFMIGLRTTMILVGVFAAILVAMMCIALGFAIRAGLTDVRANMQLAANMKNDRVKAMSGFITEIKELAEGFTRMNDKLLEARAFLPQHMLVSEDDFEDAEDEAAAALNANNGANRAGGNGGKNLLLDNMSSTGTDVKNGGGYNGRNRKTSAAFNNGGGAYDSSTTATGTDRTKSSGGPAVAGISGQIATRRVTVLSINVRNFHRHVNPSAPNTVTAPTRELTDLINTICTREKGMIDAFHGDHFVLSFNAVRANAEGPSKATKCAMDILSQSLNSRVYSMGISTGRATVGHMGSATLKRMSIIGQVYSRAMALEKACRRFNPSQLIPTDDEDDLMLTIQCVCDGLLASEIQHSYIVQVLGGLFGKPFNTNGTKANTRGSTGDILFAIRGVNSAGNGNGGGGGKGGGDEWMYELNQVSNNRLADVNKAVLAYLSAICPVATNTFTAVSSPPSGTHANTNNSASVNIAASQLTAALNSLSQEQMALPEETTKNDPLFWEVVAYAYKIAKTKQQQSHQKNNGKLSSTSTTELKSVSVFEDATTAPTVGQSAAVEGEDEDDSLISGVPLNRGYFLV